LEVFPAGDLIAAGTVGGPFSPGSQSYTLTNSGESTLNWAVSQAEDWVSLSGTSGSLAAGASTSVAVSLNGNANSLEAGGYSDTVIFANTTTGNGNTTRGVRLTVEPATTTVDLVVSVNNPAWGSVSPPGGSYAAGTPVDLTATPTAYFRFDQWTGDVAGTNNPLSLLLETNVSVQAVFAEILTTNYPTPLWWLVDNGYTNDFEQAVTLTGANGMRVWQSYVAGLDPNDPASQLRLSGQPDPVSGGYVLNWSTVTGRVYSLWAADDLTQGFAPLDGAVDLPATVNSLTNAPDEGSMQRFYWLQVRKP
jgi:hypothetical protein